MKSRCEAREGRMSTEQSYSAIFQKIINNARDLKLKNKPPKDTL
jgi:hypothetical protein